MRVLSQKSAVEACAMSTVTSSYRNEIVRYLEVRGTGCSDVCDLGCHA